MSGIKLIIDANIILAALLKGSITRELILSGNIEMFSPDYVIDEISKYRNMVIQRGHLDISDYQSIYDMIIAEINIIPKNMIRTCIGQALDIIGERDPKDILYIAAALCLEVEGIWTNDKDFTNIKEMKIFTTTDLVNLFSSKK